jgi:hypothetical protein
MKQLRFSPRSGVALFALAAVASLVACLAACGPPDPPPDVLKTQRQTLERARGVEATIDKADQSRRKQADDASE